MASALGDWIRAEGEAGNQIDLSGRPEPDRTIDAAELRGMFTGRAAATFDPSGLRIRGLHVQGPLDLSYCTIDVPVHFYECTFDETVNLARLTVRGLDFVSCEMTAVHAASIDVSATLSFEGSTITQDLTLIAARTGADLLINDVNLTKDGGTFPTLVLSRSKVVGTCSLGGSHVSAMRARGMSVEGDLVLSGARFGDEEQPLPRVAIDLVGCATTGAVDLNDMRVHGEALLEDLKAGRSLNLAGTDVTNRGDDAITLDGAVIGGDVALEQVATQGTVRCVGMEVAGSMRLVDAELRSDDGLVLSLEGATVRAALTLHRSQLVGGVRIFQTSVGVLDDDLGVSLADGEDRPLGSWTEATTLDLRGLAYARLATWDPTTSELRRSWLAGTTAFDPESWQQLSSLYSASGQDTEARQVLIAREDDRVRRMPTGPRKLVYKLFDLTVRYGYRPERAAFMAVLVVGAFAIGVAQTDSLTPSDSAPAPRPQPVVYALDVFLPIIDFGLAGKWIPAGSFQWAQWAVIALGWALSTLIVAGYVRLVRDPK